MAEVKSREQLEAEWWERWHAEDFTWEGLAKKPLEGWIVHGNVLRQAVFGEIYGKKTIELPMLDRGTGRPANLQDYWRADPTTGSLRSLDEMAEELVEVDNQPTYHSVHLPLCYENGTPTGKEEWLADALDKITAARLIASTDTLWVGLWNDRKIQGTDGRAQFQGGVWLRAVAPRVRPTTLIVRYDFSAFTRTIDFNGERFSGDTQFTNSVFFGTACFGSTHFEGDVCFRDGVFLGDANFSRSMFLHDVRFSCATFLSATSFENAKFSGEARFTCSEFFGDAYFNSAIFSLNADFSSAVFSEDGSFHNVRFDGDAAFDCATFSQEANFYSSTFSKYAKFNLAQFSKMCFVVALFEKPADFSHLSWSSEARDWHGAFEQAIFRETASFLGAGFRGLAAFDGAILERGVLFDEPSETEAEKVFAAELKSIAATVDFDIKDYRKQLEDTQEFYGPSPTGPTLESAVQMQFRKQREMRLRQLERGCRVLKQAMEKSSNKSREQLLYRFELKARRAQSDLPMGEKLFSYLYGWTSNYGASLIRPAICLGGILLIFGLIYWGAGTSFLIDTSTSIAWHSLGEALSVSASRVFPFGAFESVTEDWMKDREGQGGAALVLILRLLATIQTLLALGLAFLFGLALRRRFQIS